MQFKFLLLALVFLAMQGSAEEKRSAVNSDKENQISASCTREKEPAADEPIIRGKKQGKEIRQARDLPLPPPTPPSAPPTPPPQPPQMPPEVPQGPTIGKVHQKEVLLPEKEKIVRRKELGSQEEPPLVRRKKEDKKEGQSRDLPLPPPQPMPPEPTIGEKAPEKADGPALKEARRSKEDKESRMARRRADDKDGEKLEDLPLPPPTN